MENDDRKNNGLYTLSQTINPFVKKMLGKKGFVEVDILTNWDNIVGQDLAEYSLPERIDFKTNQKQNGVLHLSVLSGAHALELKHKERIILDKINAYFGYGAVSGLKIMQNPEAFNQQNLEVKEDKVVVSQDEENYINNLTKGVTDPSLRETLVKLGKRIINENKEET